LPEVRQGDRGRAAEEGGEVNILEIEHLIEKHFPELYQAPPREVLEMNTATAVVAWHDGLAMQRRRILDFAREFAVISSRYRSH
jgi:hypothetical protein